MPTRNFLLHPVFFLFIFSGIISAEPLTLSLEDSVRLALENNTAVKQERIAKAVARAKDESSWNVFLPDISLSASLRNIHELAGSSDHTGSDLSASAGLRLTLQPSVAETLSQTAFERKRAEVQQAEIEASVSRTVKKSYYAIATERQRLALYEKNFVLAQREASLVKKNYDAGLASELSLLQAQYAAASLEPELMKTGQEFRQTLRGFNILIGIAPETEVIFTDSLDYALPMVCLPENIEERIEARTDIVSARIALEITQSRRRAGTLNRYAPSISLSESIAMSDLQNEVSPPDTGTFNLSVSIPLNGYIPGSASSITAKEFAAAVEQAELALNEKRTQALEQISVLVDTLNRLQKSIDLTRLNESFAVRAYELSREGYDSGLVTQTDLDSTRQKSLEARFSVINAAYLYKTALIELAYALGIQESALCPPGDLP